MTKSASDAQHKWLLVREIFDEIVDLPDPERISFLDSRTSDPFVPDARFLDARSNLV